MKIPSSLKIDNLYRQYCLNCFREGIIRIYDDAGLTKYLCSNCNKILERSLVLDPAIIFWIDGFGNYWHKSVGILVYNQNKQLLLFKRTIFPYVFTIPAGHLDKNEQPLQAAKRELKEESGLEIKSLNLIFEGFVPGDSCRRGSDHHYWYLYKITVQKAEIEIKNNDEGGHFAWMDINELSRNEITVPIKFFLESGLI